MLAHNGMLSSCTIDVVEMYIDVLKHINDNDVAY